MSAQLHRENSRRSKLVEKVGTRAKKRNEEGGERREVFSSPPPPSLLPFVVVVAVFATKHTFMHLLDPKRLLRRLRQEKSSTTQQDWFGTATQPLFHCLGTPIWWM